VGSAFGLHGYYAQAFKEKKLDISKEALQRAGEKLALFRDCRKRLKSLRITQRQIRSSKI